MTSGRVSARVDSRAWQTAGVVMAVLVVAAMNRQSDGLWFQGDSPRHAVNGLFWWDLLKASPRDPVDYAVRYYARYPVIAPASYPPLFYILEGLAFASFCPSPYVARFVVLLCAGTAGLYTMAWGRRWIDPLAGWSGTFLAFTPGMVLWSNAVMLNVPATAAGLASLYHFRRWLETASGPSSLNEDQTTWRWQLTLCVVCVTAALLTYYPSASVLPILAAWGLVQVGSVRFDRKPHAPDTPGRPGLRDLRWLPAAGAIALVPLIAALRLAPVHTARHLPTLAFLSTPATWTYYWRMLPGVIGRVPLALGLAGCAAGFVVVRWRAEATYIGLWIAVLILGLSFLPARDPRYVLLAAPAFVLAGAIGVVSFLQSLPGPARLQRFGEPRPLAWHAALLAAALCVGLWSAAAVRVPRVSGFRELATYLRDAARTDAVLYDGDYDGIFGFYVRALDPTFERRVALADKLLYHYGPTTTFAPVETSKAATPDEVVSLLRRGSGCRWVAIEVSLRRNLPVGQRLLREAVGGSQFELVRSFPITGAGERRVDLYRVIGTVAPVETLDLAFPSFSEREFHQVAPITR
jgi:hypothetical protein